MKKIIHLLLLLPTIALQAQQLNECTKVEYVYSYKISESFAFSQLWDSYFNGSKGISLHRTSTDQAISSGNESDNVYVSESEYVFEPYHLIDISKKSYLFFNTLGKHVFLVEDIYPNIQWEITEDTKTIAEYECIKATTNYRGRTWNVWFTPEIAISFGPWKFHGLPGLVLEAEDSTGLFSFTLSSISTVETDLFSKDFGSLMETKNKKPMPYEKLLKDRKEYHDNVSKEIAAKYGATVTNTTTTEYDMEREYEWETENK